MTPGVVRIIPLVKGTETDGRDQSHNYYRQGRGDTLVRKERPARLTRSAIRVMNIMLITFTKNK